MTNASNQDAGWEDPEHTDSGGFMDVRLALKPDCDSRNPRNPRVTVEGYPAGARAWFVATRA